MHQYLLPLICFRILNLKYYFLKFPRLEDNFQEKKIYLLIKNIIEMDILEEEGIIIIHRKKGELDKYPKKFKVIDIKNYGLSTFVFGKSN